MWTLMLIIVTSGFAYQMKFEQIPMMDKTACLQSAEYFLKNSDGIGIICISSNTGEVIKIRGKM